MASKGVPGHSKTSQGRHWFSKTFKGAHGLPANSRHYKGSKGRSRTFQWHPRTPNMVSGNLPRAFKRLPSVPSVPSAVRPGASQGFRIPSKTAQGVSASSSLSPCRSRSPLRYGRGRGVGSRYHPLRWIAQHVLKEALDDDAPHDSLDTARTLMRPPRPPARVIA